MKNLGWNQIEVRVMSVQDALHKLKLEISENENRKEFSFKERMEWAKLLEKEISKKAKENMLKGETLSPNERRVNTNKEVSRAIEMSQKTYERAKYIYKNADEEMIKKLDDTDKISTVNNPNGKEMWFLTENKTERPLLKDDLSLSINEIDEVEVNEV